MTSSDSGDEPVRVPWFQKPCSFKDLASLEDLEAAVSPSGNNGKMTVVDFYAGWCASCKSSHPALCRIPSNDFLAANFNFYKANIESGDLAAYIKKRNVRGIPYLMVFDRDGSDLIGMGASFKKLEAVRKGLDFIARAELKDGKREGRFTLDPNGFIIQA